MKKKVFLCIAITLLTCGIGYVGYMYYLQATTIHFMVDNKEVKEHTITLEYKDNLQIDKKQIKLQAFRNKKDISKYIKVEKHELTQLKTYEINFYIDEWDLTVFPCKVKIKDTTSPTISGKTSYELMEGETFDVSKLELDANDNFDKNMKDKIKCDTTLDTTKVGEHNLVYYVEDSSGNKTEFQVAINVKAKPKQQITSSTNTTKQIVQNPNDITVLVNKNYALPDGWAPYDLVNVGNGQYLRQEAANSVLQMLQAIRNSGISANIISSYRSQSTQTSLFNSYMASDPVNAPYYSAPPRSSEHELGLAIDISYNYQLLNTLHTSALGIWLNAHAHEYGWILRYPYDKTHITGYMFEPWHYRYVGTSLASYLKANNLTLEEYYNAY